MVISRAVRLPVAGVRLAWSVPAGTLKAANAGARGAVANVATVARSVRAAARTGEQAVPADADVHAGAPPSQAADSDIGSDDAVHAHARRSEAGGSDGGRSDDAPSTPGAAAGRATAPTFGRLPGQGTVARAAVQAAGLGARAASDTVRGFASGAERIGHVTANAVSAGGARYWHVGPRVHLPLRPQPGATVRSVEAASCRVAEALAQRPDVVTAYWDGGLARLVLQLTEDAVSDRVVDEAGELAARHDLERPEEDVLESGHPGHPGGVRSAAVALALDVVGLSVAVPARALGFTPGPRLFAAATALLREDPRVRSVVRDRLGRRASEVLFAATTAATEGIGRSPLAIGLDAAVRITQLTEAMTRASVFDRLYDDLCGPDRVSITGEEIARPELRPLPSDTYQEGAVAGAALGALGTLVFNRDPRTAAEALRAGNPRAARCGREVFTAVLSGALAREDVLVRDIDRLARLCLVDTVVLHGEALRDGRRSVLEAHPSSEDWSQERLWRAARETLEDRPEQSEQSGQSGQPPGHPGDPGSRPDGVSAGSAHDAEPAERAREERLALRPVPDSGGDARAGLMIASVGGVDVGTVLVGYEPHPLAETLLDAARRAELDVLLVDDGSLGEIGRLADRSVEPDERLPALLDSLRREGRTVLTVAHIAAEPAAKPDPLLGALRRSDIALSLTDRQSAVVWGADALLLGGLTGAWRLISAVPGARTASDHARILAQSGAALSGLLVVTHGERPSHVRLPAGLRLAPVDVATAAALLSGWRHATRVAVHGRPHPQPRVAWHALPPREAVERLARERAEVRSDLASVLDDARRVGRRVLDLPLAAPVVLTARLASAAQRELNDPLTPALLVGALATALLGSSLDALLVTGALALNALIGAGQRVRAERALSALTLRQSRLAHRLVAPAEAAVSVPATAGEAAGHATEHDGTPHDGTPHDVGQGGGHDGGPAPSPDGRTADVDARRLVLGDVIALGTGEVVPADARLLEADGLEVDESSLTGESLPVRKHVPATPGAPVAERGCMVFEGTTVVAGQATAVVVGTGEATEAGRAAHLATHAAPAPGVQARLQELTRRLLPFTLLGGVAVALLSLLRGRPVHEAVRGGLPVAVAAVPEGLPLVATVTQLAAARRLSRRGVLVRSPRTLEALGRMDTVCFDKTGTLTENHLRVGRVTAPDGTGYDAGSPDAARLLREAARTCPDIGGGGTGHSVTGRVHATDSAIVEAAPEDPDWSLSGCQPFEAARGYASAVGTDESGRHLVVKGAPEVVLPGCASASEEARRAVEQLAGQGLRVLAVATRALEAESADGSTAASGRSVVGGPGAEGAEPERSVETLGELTLLGFVALADTPRPGSARLVAALREAGVHPVVLTGDHPGTARAMARQLGWDEDPVVVTGDALLSRDKAARARILHGCDVVARVAPEQKLQVVEALQAAGKVVAMVGDGANDAAAIRAADIGVGVAVRGSAAARNAADLVLLDDELTALADAVAEGRALWQSVADAVGILVGGNAGEVGFAVLGTLLDGTSPLTTRQILLVNLFTDIFPALAVAVTPRQGQDEDRGGVGGPGGLDARMARRIGRRGAATAMGGTCAWLVGNVTPGTRRRTRTMALCGVVGAQLVQTVQGRRGSPLVLFTALGSAVALAALVETPGVSQFFGCTPLGPVAWAGVLAAVAIAGAAARAERH